MPKEFEMKDLGPLKYILGIEVSQKTEPKKRELKHEKKNTRTEPNRNEFVQFRSMVRKPNQAEVTKKSMSFFTIRLV